jgi:hypothetical protein
VKLPWWLESWTVWAGAIAITLCFLPVFRDFIHQAGVDIVKAQALFHIVLRFKTEFRTTKLSQHFKEEGNGP